MNREILTRKKMFDAMRVVLKDFGKRYEIGSISQEVYQGAQLAIERILHELNFDKMKID